MPSLKLSFLGSPQIELDSAPVQIERRKAVALLAYLAVTSTPPGCDVGQDGRGAEDFGFWILDFGFWIGDWGLGIGD